MALLAHPVLARHDYGGLYCMVAAAVYGLNDQSLHGRRLLASSQDDKLRGVAGRLDI